MTSASTQPASTDGPTVVVARGRLLCYRMFHVADEIRLDEAARRLGAGGVAGAAVAGLTLATALRVVLGSRPLPRAIPGLGAAAEVSVQLFAFGAASVLFEIPIVAGTSFDDLVAPCSEMYVSEGLEAMARAEVAAVAAKARDALLGRHDWAGSETYTVVYVDEVRDGPRNAAAIAGRPALARLLLGETRSGAIAKRERREIVRDSFSYFDDDLAVIDWNSALVLEPSGRRDIPDLLELATSQLLELRYYDTRLDAEIARIYDEVAAARRRPWALLWSPYPRLARDVLVRFAELTEATERVENAIKVLGDPYNARLYRAAVRRFRIPTWQSNVYRKQALVARTYAMLNGEIAGRRTKIVEIAFFALIVLELTTLVWTYV